MLLRTHDFNSSTELTMHPQGSGGNWGLGSLALDGEGDDRGLGSAMSFLRVHAKLSVLHHHNPEDSL